MRFKLAAVSMVAIAALVTAGCHANAGNAPGQSGGSAKPWAGQTSAPKQGGTLQLLSSSKEIHFDPAKSQNLGTSSIHLLERGLTTWQTDPTADTKVVGDLATDTGQASDNAQTWTYHLKPGLKFSDGSAITSQDIKFGVERSFDPQLQGGLSYHKSLLVGGDTYKGPANGDELASIETPDATTIVFKLNKPFPDWPWIVSMPAFAPVPHDKGMGIPAYDHTPIASGPYMVDSYTVGSQVTLKRNPNWDKSTDPVRSAGPDTIHWTMGLNADTLAQRVIDDQGDDKNAAGAGVVTSLIPKINADPAVKARTTISSSGALSYIALNTTRPGLSDLRVRQAINYAINKQQIQTVAGGPAFGGPIASTLLPPGIQGHQDYNLYDGGPTGNPDKAKATLGGAAVQPLTLAISGDSATQGPISASIVSDLAKIGITVKVVTSDSDTQTNTCTNKGDYDMCLTSWQADYPGAYAQLEPLFASSEIGNGNYNMAQLNDPAIDAAMAKAAAETDPTQAAQQWGELDRKIMELAPVVPLYYSHQAYINGSNTTGTYIPSFPSYPNVLIQGLKG